MNKVASGSPAKIPASVWNNVLDATDDYNRRRALGNGGGTASQPTRADRVQVRNDTGADLPLGSVVEFTDMILDELDPANIWLAGDTPDGTNGYGIVTKPLPDEQIGPCQVIGVCAALVNITSTSHSYARVKSGETVLESAASGSIRIFYKPTGTGEKLCAVLLGGGEVGMLLGKPDSDISAGGTGTISIYSGADRTDTNENLEAYAIVALTEDKWVGVELIDGTYYAFKIEC